jgi:hypothetical protein
MKPEEQWTDNDKQIVARYQAMKSSGSSTSETDLFKNDFRSAVTAYNKIKSMPLSPEEVKTRQQTVIKRMLEAYPTESKKVRDYFDMQSLDEEMS